MRIKNNIELQTDEKNIKVCTWLEHMFSNICFQNQISGTTNVLLIKRKCEHHYKGSDRYMVPPAGPAFGGEDSCFPPPKSAPWTLWIDIEICIFLYCIIISPYIIYHCFTLDDHILLISNT